MFRHGSTGPPTANRVEQPELVGILFSRNSLLILRELCVGLRFANPTYNHLIINIAFSSLMRYSNSQLNKVQSI